MTCSRDGVRLSRWLRMNPFSSVFFSTTEFVLSLFLAIALAGHLVFPDQARAALGVSSYISYQGRLTDTNGNPLGGSGTKYCFRFSIYDAGSGGTLLWPMTSGAMSTSTTVTNGVFNVDVGSATGDTPTLGSYLFSGNDTEYLNVEVNNTPTTCGGTWETLSPRQRLDAVPYARTAFELYGGNARIGTGGGVTSGNQKYLSLDVTSSNEAAGAACPTNAVNGSLWYNSVTSRVLICNNNIIGVIAATSSIPQGAQAQGAASAVTNGIINFSAQNNLTITQNGSTIQFSGPSAQFGMSNIGNSAGATGVITGGNLSLYLAGGANITLSQSINGSAATISIVGGAGGGGGGATISHWPPFPVGLAASTNYTGSTSAGTNITASFHVAPLQLEQALAYTRINMIGSNITTIAGTGSASIAHMLGIYTLNGGTALSLSISYMFRQQISQSSVTAETHRWYWGTNSTANSSSTAGNIASLIAGARVLPLFASAAGNTLSAGQYWIAYAQTNVTAGSNIISANSVMNISQSLTSAHGQLGSAVSLAPAPLMGYFSSTTTAGNYTTPFMPSSINTTAILFASTQMKWPYVQFLGK